MDVIKAKLNPTVLSFFRSFNEIEYSGNIKFATLKPFGDDIVKNPLVYKNCRRYYERPDKIAWLSDDNHKHSITNVVRVDNDDDDNISVSTKFKIYKETFNYPSVSDVEQKQRYSFTGSIELPVRNVDCKRFKGPFKKMLYITYWHLLIDERLVFRVAFRENALNESIHCNIECETQAITRREFVECFQLLKSHYIYQNENMRTIEPWAIDDVPSKLSVRVISREEANELDSRFIDEKFDGKLEQRSRCGVTQKSISFFYFRRSH